MKTNLAAKILLAITLSTIIAGVAGYVVRSHMGSSESFGDTQDVLPTFKRITGGIVPRVSTNDFAIGSSTATSSAPFAVNVRGDDVTVYGSGSFTGFALSDCDADNQTLAWDSTTGQFGCGDDDNSGGGGSSFSGLDTDAGGTPVKVTSLSFEPNQFNFTNIASAGTVRLDWSNGPASRSMTNTWSAINTFSSGASVSTSFEVAGTASVSRLLVGSTTTTSLLNIGIDSTGSNDGARFGTDTTLYRVAASNLRTGGTFSAVTRVNSPLFSNLAGGVTIAAESGGDVYLGATSGLTSQATNLILYPSGNIGIGTTAPSTKVEVAGTASISAFSLTDSSTGVGIVDCDGDTQALGFDTTTGRFFCGDDDSGGASGSKWTESGNLTYLTDTNNDLATGGTASTTAPFVVDLNTGTDARIGLGGATTASLSLGIDDSDTDAFVLSTGNTLGTNNLFRILSGGATVSVPFEVRGLASSSTLFGSGLVDCDSDGSQLLWSNTGVFSCQTLADADIPDTITASNYQPLDATLTALAAYNTNGILTQTAADTFVGRTLTGTSNQITVTNGDGVSANPTFSIPTPFIIPGRASVSSNFEILGTASASSNLWIGGNSTLIGTLGVTGLSTLGALTATGVIDFGDATSTELANGTNPTINAEGETAIDTSGFGQLVYYASGSEHTITDEKKITLSLASTSFSSFSSRSLGYQFRGITVKRIWCKTSNATSVVINLSSNGTADMDQLTCATTNTFDDGSISNATITKGNELVLERRTISNGVDFLTITFTYVETRE